MSQRIEGRFVRDPQGESKSRLWLADAGRGKDARTARPDEEGQTLYIRRGENRNRSLDGRMVGRRLGDLGVFPRKLGGA